MKAVCLVLNSLLVALLSVSAWAAQDRYFLDLTLPQRLPPPAKSSFGCGPRLSAGSEGGGFVLPTLPLAVEIVSFDKNGYAPGEEMVCEVRLTNVGNKPLRIPWSPNPAYRNTDCSPVVQGMPEASFTGSLALVFTDSSGARHLVLLKSLYGRLAIPETFRVLAPGESAGVKLRERLVFFNARPSEPAASVRLPHDFFVTAIYDLDDTSQGNPYRTVHSKNSMEVRIAGWRTP